VRQLDSSDLSLKLALEGALLKPEGQNSRTNRKMGGFWGGTASSPAGNDQKCILDALRAKNVI